MANERTTAAHTERIRSFYERAAGGYDRGMDLFDWLLFGQGRPAICALARGDTLEIGIGTGRNLPFYPPEVRLTGLDLSPAMLELAEKRAGGLELSVELRVGDAQALEFAESSFDTVVSTLSLCTIPDCRKAATEAHRVLRPGGC